MVKRRHPADDSGMRIALDAGEVFQPRAERDPDSGGWVVVARGRQGGAERVLTGEHGKTVFPCLDQAWREADRLRSRDTQHLVGRRRPRTQGDGNDKAGGHIHP
jgi:hypothetical protein